MNGLVYLACPYSHLGLLRRELRFATANRVAAILMARGLLIFSPISHSHPIARAGDLPTDWAYWERYNRAILGCCSGLLVLAIDGWRESVGVQAELQIAREQGLVIGSVDEAGVVRLGEVAA